jgi:hypothetical protein
MKPTGQAFESYVDADFQGGWNHIQAQYDLTTEKSRSSYIIMYSGCAITWISKLQTDIALSTTESEYSMLSEAARKVL